ncbi:dephospho-CoA kinase [Vampirovibrio chlorellavorus]|uniref:dephospho-CoA kinase n=1 Tax=Vampirovibrio chlorellavorus TaxID=758823 RepID=UPI0026F06EEA|nr:dephospho-CoA kinase [Vampirovibrio chlorellavorus]
MVCRIALTGGIASGKSLAGEYLKSQGIPVIDADDVVHALLREDAELNARIREAFGPAVFDESGAVNRPALGGQVFQHPERRKLLESWIHPKTRQRIEAFFAENADRPAAVAIIPLLFESGLAERYDQVWLLDTEPAVQLARLIQKRRMSEADALARIRSQLGREEKQALTRQHPGGVILPNTGSPEALQEGLAHLLSALASP